MAIGKLASTLIVLGTGVIGAAVYSPETAEKYWPDMGAKAAVLRDYLPEFALSKLPPSKFAKASLGAKPEAGAKPSGPVAAPPRPPVSVVIAPAIKGPMPVQLDAIGTIQPVATVALRSRADAQIDQVLVADGAAVKTGDVLVKLDSRQIEAQIKQAEATLGKDNAQLDQANRDVARYADLLSHGTGIQINLDNAKTVVAGLKASILGDQAILENLKVQLTWYTISAPITGRIGTFAAKAGNIIRSGDSSSTGTLVTINQITPIYLVFSLPQAKLPELRAAMAAGGAKAVAVPQGLKNGVEGSVAVVDNSIDPATGTITARAIFENPKDILWPGQLCNVRVTLRVEADTVSVPREAVQNGQNGTFVFVIEDGTAKARPVKVARTQDADAVISEGLKGGEAVVVDGAVLLVNNSKVEIRTKDPKKGV